MATTVFRPLRISRTSSVRSTLALTSLGSCTMDQNSSTSSSGSRSGTEYREPSFASATPSRITPPRVLAKAE